MSEHKGKQDKEHIEELLSQLKGIFGHLSETEQAEAKQKITPPSEPPPPAKEPSKPAPQSPEPVEEEIPLAPWITPSDPAPAPADPPPVEPPAMDFTPAEIEVPAGATLTPAAVFYPNGRANEAKLVADKIEKITPKFTKVTVVLNVQSLMAYDPKADIKTSILPHVEAPIKAVFVIIDKSMEDARRKALAAALEPKGIYFQEIPFHQIEKKALYTDMLLGMVFFFDSQKKPGESAE